MLSLSDGLRLARRVLEGVFRPYYDVAIAASDSVLQAALWTWRYETPAD
jgi:hypothetical protein